MKYLMVALLLARGFLVFAQPAVPANLTDDAIHAMTRRDYPATPGDVYLLTYIASVSTVQTTALVDARYQLNLGFFGTIDGRQLTFEALRTRVLDAVRRIYPNGHPELIIVSVGRYDVHLAGHVERTGYVRATGLTRLSDVVEPRALPSASLRRVTIERDGSRTIYDLFAASRFGRRDQDPYLRPGDVVAIPRAERIVRIDGEVRRSGDYELLDGEHLAELVSRFADGYTPEAAVEQLYINRGGEGEQLIRIRPEPSRTAELRNNDHVVVPSRRDYLPAVSFQGAVVPDPGSRDEDAREGTRHQQFPYRFVPGETLRQAVQAVQSWISPRADLSRAEYFRAGSDESVPVNLHTLLFDYRSNIDIELAANDRIVIAFGTFEIFITGEVSRAQYVDVESLTRLSGAVLTALTPYSSTRNVRVTSVDGTTTVYDLFLAERYGRRDQDPYLRPGDTVEVGRADRIVVMEGEVRRPGTYELLPGEQLGELVETYGDGFTPDADTAELRITRTLTSHPAGREVVELSFEPARGFVLVDADRVVVRSESLELPYLFLEGAIVSDVGSEDSQGGYSGRRVQIVPGYSLRGFVRDHRTLFQPNADLAAARLYREDGTELAVDLEVLLYNSEPAGERVLLTSGDRVFVPFRNPVVIVSGAVARPGSYPYVPERSVEYYINLAGGYNPAQTWFRTPRVSGPDGTRLNARKPIPAETTIVVPVNNLLVATQIGAIVSLTSSVISLLLLLSR